MRKKRKDLTDTTLHKLIVDVTEHMISNLESDNVSDIDKYQRMLNHLATYEYKAPPADSDKQLFKKAQELIHVNN